MSCVQIKQDPRSPGLRPGDEFVFTRSWGHWHLVGKRFLVWNVKGPSRDGYDIDLWSINSHQELLDWLFHVGGKSMDPANYFEAMQTIFRDVGYSGTVTVDGKALAIRYWNESVPHRKSIHGS